MRKKERRVIKTRPGERGERNKEPDKVKGLGRMEKVRLGSFFFTAAVSGWLLTK